jgi:glutathione S-transferase
MATFQNRFCLRAGRGFCHGGSATNMIELYQFPWSPFCIAQRRILEFSQTPFKIVNVPNTDRAKIWQVTRQRYYQVPVVKDGKQVIFETDEGSQVVAKYLNQKLGLGLFPDECRGLQNILWLFIENEIEGLTFKLNDIYFREFVPAREHLAFIRHKERKFGRGCIEQWQAQQKEMLGLLKERLLLFEQMLLQRPFLLDERPRFVDFDLYGMLGNFLFSGHYELPPAHTRLKEWYKCMTKIKASELSREKLHS